LVLTDIT